MAHQHTQDGAEVLMSPATQLHELDERNLVWGTLLKTGIGDTRLRNAHGRGIFQVGVRHVGRWLFSSRELFVTGVLHAVEKIGVTMGTAAIAAKRVAPDLEILLAACASESAEARALQLCVRRMDKTVLVFYFDPHQIIVGKTVVPILPALPDYAMVSVPVVEVISHFKSQVAALADKGSDV